MAATIAHLGWRKVFSVLRHKFEVHRRRVAMALYHVPYRVVANKRLLRVSGKSICTDLQGITDKTAV